VAGPGAPPPPLSGAGAHTAPAASCGGNADSGKAASDPSLRALAALDREREVRLLAAACGGCRCALGRAAISPGELTAL